ncbi:MULTISPECIES: hypothetical protein [unclassified Shinella]|uniref:hypothetical protein n=1 Tax=unclassified Shinella TaxID=2643062 RepID=UPI0012E1273B|nr:MULTISPECIES: hypothetical protein [unclassified Shinella]
MTAPADGELAGKTVPRRRSGGTLLAANSAHISDFFKTMRLRFEKCLEPALSCSAAAINAHSVQNATAMSLIAQDNHVYELRTRIRDGQPKCDFEKVGRNQASTFPGFCGVHDTELFKPIDTKPISLADREQLFLIAYRSVSRELHTVMEAAMRLQATLQFQIAAGRVPKDQPSVPMIEATQHMLKSWGVWKHRLEHYDKPLLSRRFEEIEHSVFEILNRKPALAASSFFSVDNKPWGKPFSAVALNVIPTSSQSSVVIVSYPKAQSGAARRYVAPVFLRDGEERLAELSCLLIDRAENFFVAPSQLATWNDDKKKEIVARFVKTAFDGQRGERNDGLLLF